MKLNLAEFVRKVVKLFGVKFQRGGAIATLDIAEIIRQANPPPKSDTTDNEVNPDIQPKKEQ